MDGVVHFEIPADDAERAKAFYSTAFDWEMQDFPDMQYTIMMTTPIDDQLAASHHPRGRSTAA